MKRNTLTVKELSEKNVIKIYSGIDGKCCCGCSGTYYHNPLFLTENFYSGKISMPMVKKVIRIIKNAEKVDRGETYFATVIGKRLYIAYIA